MDHLFYWRGIDDVEIMGDGITKAFDTVPAAMMTAAHHAVLDKYPELADRWFVVMTGPPKMVCHGGEIKRIIFDVEIYTP